MKKGILFPILLFTALLAGAQAYEGTISFDKKKQAALVIDYSYPAEAVENAFTNHLEKLGFKSKEEKGLFNKDKGFIVFRNALVPEINGERTDYIIKVERKSRKESDESTLYLVLSRDNSNVLSGLSPDDLRKAKNFLNTLQPEIEAAYLEIKIHDQEDLVAKTEKKLKDLKDEQESLEKKLKDNKDDQEKTRKDLEAQKQELGKLQGQRKVADQ